MRTYVPRNIRAGTRTGYQESIHDDDDSYETFLIFPENYEPSLIHRERYRQPGF